MYSSCSLISLRVSNFQAFSVVFEKAIEKAEPATEVVQRVSNLIDCVTFSVFIYTTRGLFEKDKLIFTAQVAFQVCIYSSSFSIYFHIVF